MPARTTTPSNQRISQPRQGLNNRRLTHPLPRPGKTKWPAGRTALGGRNADEDGPNRLPILRVRARDACGPDPPRGWDTIKRRCPPRALRHLRRDIGVDDALAVNKPRVDAQEQLLQGRGIRDDCMTMSVIFVVFGHSGVARE